jgi:hypothetical protein
MNEIDTILAKFIYSLDTACGARCSNVVVDTLCDNNKRVPWTDVVCKPSKHGKELFRRLRAHHTLDLRKQHRYLSAWKVSSIDPRKFSDNLCRSGIFPKPSDSKNEEIDTEGNACESSSRGPSHQQSLHRWNAFFYCILRKRSLKLREQQVHHIYTDK